MNRELGYPAPDQQPDQPEDFSKITPPEGTYQFPTAPHHEAGQTGSFSQTEQEQPVFDHRANSWSPDEEPEKSANPNRGAKIIAGITGTAILAGGLFLGGQKLMAKDNHENPSEGKRPAATGEVTPGEKTPSTETNQTGESKVGEASFSKNMEFTNEGIELPLKDENGNITEVVKGVYPYMERIQFDTNKYNLKDALHRLPFLMTEFVNSGDTPEEQQAWKNYKDPQGQYKGAEGIRLGYLGPIYEAALTDERPEDILGQGADNPGGNFVTASESSSIYQQAFRAHDTWEKHPDYRRIIKLDTEEGFDNSGMTVQGGNDEIGYDATLYLKVEEEGGFKTEDDGTTFKIGTTWMKRPGVNDKGEAEGTVWKMVGARYIEEPPKGQ